MTKFVEFLMMGDSVEQVEQKKIPFFRKRMVVELWMHGKWKQENGYETPREIPEDDYGNHWNDELICHQHIAKDDRCE